MDKAKFQFLLSQSLKDICLVQCTLNCVESGFIPSVCSNGRMLNYDLLIIEQHIGNVILDIKVSFKDENNPWATINIKDTHLGVGFYANEDPQRIVWEMRVIPVLKAELVKLNIADDVKSAIDVICDAYNKCK